MDETRSTKAVIAEPAVITADPFGEAWLFRMRITGTPELLDGRRVDRSRHRSGCPGEGCWCTAPPAAFFE